MNSTLLFSYSKNVHMFSTKFYHLLHNTVSSSVTDQTWIQYLLYINQRGYIFIWNSHLEEQVFKKKLAFDFCRFCVVIRFFHPRHNGQWPPTSKDFLYQILSITFIFIFLFFIYKTTENSICKPHNILTKRLEWCG